MTASYPPETLVPILKDLLRRASTQLPEDIRRALENAAVKESGDGTAKPILNTILENEQIARKNCVPACQDTGTPTFWFELPDGTPVRPIEEAVERAIWEATQEGLLRLNVIAVPSGKQISSNFAPGNPVLHFHFGPADTQPRVSLLLKGGGSENQSRQYALPDDEIGAGRDLEGVRRAVLDAVWHAQGGGCAPGVLGVCIGGDRAGAYACAKEQLLRPLSDVSPEPQLAELEKTLLTQANELGIGPMGLGGKTTLLGVKIATLPRLPACYFVTVAYNCWACRRATTLLPVL